MFSTRLELLQAGLSCVCVEGHDPSGANSVELPESQLGGVVHEVHVHICRERPQRMETAIVQALP